jgi:hypothetical protein
VAEILRQPISRDELIAMLAHAGLDTSRSNILISAMEIKGIISESMGEMRII